MTLKSTLKATTAAILLLSGTAAFADGHATHPDTGEVLATDQSFTYRDLEKARPSIQVLLKTAQAATSCVTFSKG